jgi:NAD(P)-dependent dehydrogenase (short-subunit alcohol dehydrogenase family)
VAIAELSETGRQVEAEIRQAGGTACYIQTDVSDGGDVRRLRETVSLVFGPADILVNNAIRITVAPAIEMDETTWDSILAVNLRGTFLACKAFLPEMLARGSGTILNMVSTEAMPGLSAYIASKQGIYGFSQSLAVEAGPGGINVIPFAPGMVDTPGIREISTRLVTHLGMTTELFLNLSMHPAYERLMPPEHAGAATVYLALRLAKEFHGQAVNGYEVLERAGFLKSPAADLPAAVSGAAGRPVIRVSTDDLFRQIDGVIEILAETGHEFEKLPAFVRPLARSGFKGKAGMSLDDWRRALAGLKTTVQAALQTDSPPAGLLQAARGLPTRLEKLVSYYRGVPAETARFTRDREMLAQVARLSNERIEAVQRLCEHLRKIGEE